MTARELSEKSGIPEKGIYKIESGGVKDPRLSSVGSIAKGLGCSLDELVSSIDVEIVTMQMIDLLKRSNNVDDVTRDYLIQMIDNFAYHESLEWIIENSDKVPEDIASDLVIKRRLELTRNRTKEDDLLLKQLTEEYKPESKSMNVHTKV